MTAAHRALGVRAPMLMLCSLSAEQHVKLARRDVAKTWKVHARSLEYTDELPASWRRARDAAGSILNLAESALPP